MRKFYIAAVLVIVFLVAWATDWNLRQGSAQLRDSTVSMIKSRPDDLLEIEIGTLPGKAPPAQKQSVEPPPRPERTPTGAKRVIEPEQPEPVRLEGEYILYEVKAGDTISEIALEQLGTTSRAKEIMTLNGIEDPKSIRPGMMLKVPRD